MAKFNVGDMVRRIGSGGDVTIGNTYEVLERTSAWVTINNDAGVNQYYQSSMFKLVNTTNELQVGETYTSYNGHSWVAIYEEDGFVWMKDNVGVADVFNKDGTSVSLSSNQKYNINWEATKGPIIEEGVCVWGTVYVANDTCDLSATVTTVDGVPDWTTLACKEL
jgi:hypothetical protein